MSLCPARPDRFLALLLLLACLPSACRTGPDPIDSPQELFEAVECHLGNGEFALALQQAVEGKSGWQDLPASDWYWRFHLLQAEVEYHRSRHKQALELLAEEMPAGPEFAEWRARRKMLQANSHRRLGHYDTAGRLLEEAEEMASRAEADRLYLPIQIRKSLLLGNTGNKAESEQIMRQVLEQAREQGDVYHEALALFNFGFFRLTSNRDHEAISFLRSFLALTDGQPCSKNPRTLAQSNLAASYGRLGFYQEAQKIRSQAIEELQAMGDPLNLERAYGGLGDLFHDQGRYSESRDAYQKALEGAQDLQIHRDAALWAGRMTTALIALAEWNDAEQANRLARQHSDALTARSPQAPIALWNATHTLLNKARIASGRGHQEAAEKAFLEVLQTPGLSSLHWQAQAGLGRLFLRLENYDKANRHFEEALSVIQRHLSGLDDNSARSLSKMEKMAFLARLMHFYRDYVDALVSQGRDLEALEVAESSRALILQENLGLKDKGLGNNSVAFTETARQLDAVFLSYWLAPGRSFLWVVSAQQIQCVPLPGAERISPRVQSFQELINRQEHTLDSSWGKQLYGMLIEPAKQWLDSAQRAVVIPDGVLHRLNFETLPVPGQSPRYWLEDIEVSVAPSLRLISGPDKLPAKSDHRLLLIGAAEPTPGFPRLKYAQDEAQLIQRSFAGATSITGPAAHPQAYRQSEPGRYSIIHFATHAEANPISPLDSAVVLSPPADAPESFRLQVREILTIPLPQTNLVTLSACDSAGSREFAGEGQVGLAWAFLHQGAQRVIAGLWKVNDRTSAQLMDSLYQKLAADLTVDQALSRAKREILQKGDRYSAPYYWAPFQLYRR